MSTNGKQLDRHVSLFDAAAIDSLARHCSELLRKGDVCVVVASPEQMRALKSALRKQDINVSAASRDNQFVTVDASSINSLVKTSAQAATNPYKRMLENISHFVSGNGRPVQTFGIKTSER